MPDPTFTLIEEKQVWVVEDDKKRRITATRYGSRTVDVRPANMDREMFQFKRSDPNLVLAIGRLLVAAARKCGATDA